MAHTGTVSVQEAAEEIGCHPDTLYARRVGLDIDMGLGQTLRIVPVGRRMRISRQELDRFLGKKVAS